MKKFFTLIFVAFATVMSNANAQNATCQATLYDEVTHKGVVFDYPADWGTVLEVHLVPVGTILPLKEGDAHQRLSVELAYMVKTDKGIGFIIGDKKTFFVYDEKDVVYNFNVERVEKKDGRYTMSCEQPKLFRAKVAPRGTNGAAVNPETGELVPANVTLYGGAISIAFSRNKMFAAKADHICGQGRAQVITVLLYNSNRPMDAYLEKFR